MYYYFQLIILAFTSIVVALNPVTIVSAATTSSDEMTAATGADGILVPSVSARPTTEVVTSTRALIAEPTIRVGLYKTAEPVMFQSDFLYEIFSGQESMGFLEAGEEAQLSYTNGVYHFQSENTAFDSPHYFRLVPENKTNYFTLKNYPRFVKGRGDTNFNVYRGACEYHYSPRSKLPYIINELPLESYIAGIAESSNEVPMEYAKALLTAARSYAYAHIRFAPPSDNWLFDVYATTQDQIYLGYNSELRMPRIAAAAVTTTGEMVTYQGAPVITPYFGHSNGKTKSWQSKGKNNVRPWLVSVTAPYDKGKKLWGHGIGMSTYDAMMRAQKDGWTYEHILKYYYTGVKIEKIY